jgi:hypothetical protein
MTQQDYAREHSASPAAGDLVCVQHAQKIHNPGGRNEARPVVPGSARNVWSSGLKHVGEEVKYSRTRVCQTPQNAEKIPGARDEYVSAQQVAGDGESANARKKQDGPDPASQQKMPQPRDNPCRQRHNPCVRILFRGGFRHGGFGHDSSGEQEKDLFLDGAGHARFLLAHINVHFAAHAEFGKINPRFD